MIKSLTYLVDLLLPYVRGAKWLEISQTLIQFLLAHIPAKWCRGRVHNPFDPAGPLHWLAIRTLHPVECLPSDPASAHLLERQVQEDLLHATLPTLHLHSLLHHQLRWAGQHRQAGTQKFLDFGYRKQEFGLLCESIHDLYYRWGRSCEAVGIWLQQKAQRDQQYENLGERFVDLACAKAEGDIRPWHDGHQKANPNRADHLLGHQATLHIPPLQRSLLVHRLGLQLLRIYATSGLFDWCSHQSLSDGAAEQ